MSNNYYVTDDPRLIGKWRSEMQGDSIQTLKKVSSDSIMELWMSPGGRARWGHTNQPGVLAADPPDAPFSTKWLISHGRDLSIRIPIPPMPEYGIDEWDLDGSINYDIMMIEEDYMLLNDRPFDGEFITLMHRYQKGEQDETPNHH